MPTLVFSDTSAGAPVLNGVNGSLNAVLDWALPQNGWAIEFTATNARVYRASTGNRLRVSVRHDSAISGSAAAATVRGCESATSATALVDPFPTTAQLADASAIWKVSSTTGATACKYFLVVSPVCVVLMVKSLAGDYWETQIFGDLPKSYSIDVWNTICTSVGGAYGYSFAQSCFSENVSGYAPTLSTRLFWARSIDGVIKSSRGWLNGSCPMSSTAVPGAVTSSSAARGGIGNYILREKAALGCGGASGTSPNYNIAAPRRGWIPNIWFPLHSGTNGMTSADSFSDTAYAAGALFRIVPTYTSGFVLLEESDTWNPPNG